MERIIISLHLPAVNHTQDVSMPSQLPIGSYLPELVNTVRDVTFTALIDPVQPMLCSKRLGVLPLEKSLAECGVHDGDTLFFL